MRTSDQIYHRVRWDARFDPARFVLGVAQRGREPKRVPFTAFDPGGDVPWHRVLFVEADGTPVWDRATGLDVLDSAGLGLVRHESLLRPPFFAPRPVRGESTGTTASVRVLTWNTLWDRYDSHRIATAERRPLLLAELAASGADVIALQEVERPLLAMLEPWTRQGWALLGEPADVDAAGLVLLSRLPVREAGWHALSGHKAVAAIVVETATGPLTVVTTHLTSDHTTGGAERRGGELTRIAEGLSGVDGDVVVMGDFNETGERPASALAMTDAWLAARADETPTFDPTVNPLAAVASLTGRAGRIDRVFLRGPRAASASLHGDTPTGGLFPSDHFGLSADLGAPAAGVLDTPRTARTALAWIPPESLWAPLQEIRRAHDPSFHRWPPHVNVLFGCVPEADFEAAARIIAEVLSGIAPFTARLGEVRRFDQGTVWQHPGDDGWTAVRAALATRFPHLTAGRAYVPHLTIGRGDIDPRLPTVDAPVGALTLLSRRGDGPMEPRATIALGTGAITWTEPAPREFPAHTADTEEIRRRLASVMPAAEVHVVGSRAIGCDLPGADVDIVAAGTADPTAIAALPGVTGFREMIDARVPGLRLHLDGTPVDIVIAPPGDAPSTAVTLSAITDAAALAGRVDTALARRVKAWARARGIDSAPFGTPPGLAWTVLAAVAGGSLREFFGHWAAWDWSVPVALDGTPEPTGEAMTVLTPTAPVRSCTSQVRPGMSDLIAEELYRAWELADSPSLLAPPPMHRRHRSWAVLTVSGEENRGRMRGRVNALLAELPPDAHAWPRPFAEDGGVARYAVGLGRDGVEERVLTAWTRGLAGVGVEMRGGGEVPTLS